MHILYHHRTRGEDAQGIHIREILRAFGRLGHSTELVSFAERNAGASGTLVQRQTSTQNGRGTLLTGVLSHPFVYECAELAYNAWGFWALNRAISSRRPELMYERYSLFNFCGIVTSKLRKIPLVLEVNAPLAHEKEHYEKLSLRRLAYALERWICNNSSATIVVSTPMRDILAREGVRQEHMKVISNAVNEEEIRRSLGRIDVRARYGLGGKLVLGFVGWFKPWHRLDSVIELLAARPDWQSNMHLLLVGDGPETDHLRQRAQVCGVEDQVTITGAVDRDLIYDHIDAFDVALQPHVTEYASPMKIFEYLALGKCVVAPDFANIREILTDGENARLFRPADAGDMAHAIEELAVDRERVRRMGKRAREVIAERRYYWLDNARRALALVGLGDPIEAESATRETVTT